MPDKTSSTRVFISYSHEPETRKFVRSLARQLRGARFDVWLDEERIPGATDIEETIREAVAGSDVGLFVVTARWLKRDRDYIRHEVSLFGQRENTRRLVLLREPASDADLGRFFSELKRLEWLPDDPQPYARFWEVFCGITGTVPGPFDQWEKNGKLAGEGKLAAGGGGGSPAAISAEAIGDPLPQAPSGRIALPFAGKPVASLTGEDWTYLVSDRDEWTALRGNGEVDKNVPRGTGYAAAAVTSEGGLMVATFESTVARLNGRRWQVLRLEAPALCLASTEGSNLAGTASGAIVELDDHGARPLFRMRDPVMSLCHFDGGILVLGSRGMFGKASLPARPGEQLKWVSTGELARVLAFFQTVESGQVGLRSATRVGMMDPETERLTVCPHFFEEGIREIAFLGAQNRPYAVMTDAGNVAMVDACFTDARQVRFPRNTFVTGLTRAGWTGTCLAWTADGQLFRIGRNGFADSIAEGDIVLAYSPAATGNAHLVRWNEKEGSTVEIVRLD